jgi:hypothetical protein
LKNRLISLLVEWPKTIIKVNLQPKEENRDMGAFPSLLIKESHFLRSKISFHGNVLAEQVTELHKEYGVQIFE